MVTPMNLNAGHLRAARERAHWSRKRLADEANVSKETVKRLELDPAASTRYETIAALAAALDIPFSELSETEVSA
jgi:transcriptional regulator with XRE-family HTH domain